MATSKLKLSLTGHISTVRGLVVSPRHPYLFSCAEDKTVKCWDLEYNKVTAIIQVEKHNSEKKKKINPLLPNNVETLPKCEKRYPSYDINIITRIPFPLFCLV